MRLRQPRQRRSGLVRLRLLDFGCARLRPHGIKRGVRGRRGRRPASGWAALTPTEVKIAILVAQGESTPDIARSMFLSRRTVQTYISHILAKLQVKSRVDIVREAMRQGVSA